MKCKIILLCVLLICLATINISCTQNGDEIVEFDVYSLTNHLSKLVEYVHEPLESKKDFDKIDLLYYLFEQAVKDEIAIKTHEVAQINYSNYNIFQVDSGILESYAKQLFDLDSKYFDRYKKEGYVFKSEYDKYDENSGRFTFVEYTNNMGESYNIVEHNTRIIVKNNEIIVKIRLSDTIPITERSADYHFIVKNDGDKIYFTLTKVNIFFDGRNVNKEHIFEIGEEKFSAPWIIFERDNIVEYYPIRKSQFYGIFNADISYSSKNGLTFFGMYGSIAYFNGVYNNLRAVYMYDVEKKSGKWMSNLLNVTKIEEEFTSTDVVDFYFQDYILSLSPDNKFALIYKSKPDSDSFTREYFIRELSSGRETYICDSFRISIIISYHEEYFIWQNSTKLYLGVLLDSGNKTYTASFDGENWSISVQDIVSFYELYTEN